MPHDLTQASANAFQICLGAAFDRLPDTIRRAHSGTIRLNGYARVSRGGPIADLLANVMGLPPAAAKVAMSVEGVHLPDRMIWKRRFGDRRFESCFRLQESRLVESLGPFRLHMQLAVQDGRLRYMLERVTLFGIAVPLDLAPSLEAWEGERDGRYDFAVEVRLPFVGRLVRYEGLLDLVP
ncbi:DUF4166 domain-containing protein [Dongia deserti]|uniref:DUF4166 domain-containing protein n=1 Tax=Dongia deserti TaxID=2268030 RepID=UPI000E652447|nr:DUF4166 domain-containing protein [Dongia deserti]